MKKTGLTAVVIGAALLSGCASGERSVSTDPTSFDLVKFPVEDCTVYRFYDSEHTAYFMRCPTGSVAKSLSTEAQYDAGCKCNVERVISH